MTVIEKAYAKINLFLDVTERRDDGFHNIVSIMQSVSLADTITLEAKKSNEKSICISCDDPELPIDQNNLIYKAAQKYLEYFGIDAEINVYLEKMIPVGAGLGGGSSDAAATLRALDKIFGLSWGDELLTIAAELGSDVPFCLIGGRAFCTGRGEKMEPITDYPINHFVISIGNEKISTPMAYRALDEKYNNFDGSIYIPKEYDGGVYNLFESVTIIDDIAKIKEMMIKNRAEYTLMSGSGPSVFGIFKNEKDAKEVAQILNSHGFVAHYCYSVKEIL